jgi:hypothetical protein
MASIQVQWNCITVRQNHKGMIAGYENNTLELKWHSFIHLLVDHRSYKNYTPVDVVTIIMFDQLCNTASVQ